MRVLTALGLVALVSACGPKETTEASPPNIGYTNNTIEVTGDGNQRTYFADGAYEPLRGDPERKALLDGLRPKVVIMLGTPVEFSITTLRVKDDWAFAVVEPVKPGGAGPLTLAETKLKDEEGEWDGLRTEAIWRKKNAGWTVEEFAVGATDVWYEPFCDTAPKGLIPICANRAMKP